MNNSGVDIYITREGTLGAGQQYLLGPKNNNNKR